MQLKKEFIMIIMFFIGMFIYKEDLKLWAKILLFVLASLGLISLNIK